jgi:hypothetical protein
MCGPSGALKDLNNKVQSFAGTMLGEAKTVFGVTHGIVQKLQSKLDSVINGGPSQMGFSQSELNAKRAAAVEAGGTMARNVKGATASSIAAIGGGNTTAPAGSTEQMLLDANVAAASRTAGDLNTIEQQGFERGNENFWKATEGEERLPGMYQTAEGFNRDAMSGLETAQKSQQEMDTQSNWWKPLVMKAGMAGLGVITGGASTAIGGTAGKMLGQFGNTMFGTNTPKPTNNSATASSSPNGGTGVFA